MMKIDIEKKLERVYQGDIIANVEFIEYAIEQDGQIEISKIIFPNVYVLTQDCDLEQEHNSRSNESNNDKQLISIIVAPLYNLEHVYLGEHLSELGLRMRTISNKSTTTENKTLLQNQIPRYHYLEFEKEFALQNSIIDFKHYFTVSSNLLLSLKKKSYIGKVSELYRENISHRFAFYLSRIGLPS